MLTDKLKTQLEQGIRNTGLDLSIPEKEDVWIGGKNSKIKYEVVNPLSVWNGYGQDDECQKPFDIDYMNCTHQSFIEEIAKQLHLFLHIGYIGQELRKDLLEPWLKNKRPYLSERKNSIDGGNTPNGNNMQNAPEAGRIFGIAPEDLCPNPTKRVSWNEYHNPDCITEEAKRMSLLFCNSEENKKPPEERKCYFDIKYEKLPTRLIMGTASLQMVNRELKHAPIVVATPCCSGWFNNGITIQACSSKPIHAVLIDDGKPTICDSYPDYVRHLASNYPMHYPYKTVLIPNPIILKNKIMTNAKKVKCADGSAGLYLPANSPTAFRSMCANAGIEVPGEAPNEVFWDDIIWDGNVTLRED